MNLWTRLTSLKTSAALLCVLALFLLLNVVVPQELVIGEVAMDSLVEERPLARFFLVTLGLGRIPTSPLFLAILGLFLLNLTTVLASRIGPTWKRMQVESPSETNLRAWAGQRRALVARRRAGWSGGAAVRALRGHGFRVAHVADGVLWAVKHRTAALGFLLFHFSFFLLFVGGGLIYYTRFVGLLTLVEGQEFDGRYHEIRRRPPTGRIPPLRFLLEQVDASYEDGFPVHLGATLRLRLGGGSMEKKARVNHPATWGPASLLIRQAGLAPGFWLQDENGYSIDRVVVAAKTLGDEPTTLPLDASSLMLTVRPLVPGSDFPGREELARTPIRLAITRGEETIFDGELRQGQAASWDGGRLVLEEIRYWAGIQVVEERGGGLLITGFLLAVIGLLWRLVWYRREVAVVWDDEEVRLAGKGEYYRRHFAHEQKEIFSDVLAGKEGGKLGSDDPSGEAKSRGKE